MWVWCNVSWPLLQVEEESGASFADLSCAFQRRQLPPSLPPAPPGLTPQQLKRRHIVAAIVHSENSYVATLQRLVNVCIDSRAESSADLVIMWCSRISIFRVEVSEVGKMAGLCSSIIRGVFLAMSTTNLLKSNITVLHWLYLVTATCFSSYIRMIIRQYS
jgi:hypothetical protein